MSWWSDVTQRIRTLVLGVRADRELREEIKQHLELDIAARVARGVAPDVARREALRVFGGVEQYYEEARDARGVRPVGELLLDLRYGIRALRRNPGFTLAAVVVLGLGIGANTAIFSAVNAVILRPLPFAEPERLVMIWEENPEKHWHQQVAAPANMFDWNERVAAFDGVAAYTCCGQGVLSGVGAPRVVTRATVTGNFATVLGVPPALGRGFTDRETFESDERVVLLSHRLWRGVFGADPAVVGRTIQLDGVPNRVVGVMPAGFAFPAPEVDYWAPTNWSPEVRTKTAYRRAHWLKVVARIDPDVTLERADAELQTVVRQLQREYPETNRVMGAGITPLQEFLIGPTRTPLLVLLAAAGLLLLIGCANVGNLLLVKTVGREREIAVRAALGAGRFRLVRQLMTESLLVSALGGAVGLALGTLAVRLLARLQPAGMLPVAAFTVDWRVVAVVAAATVVSGLLFGSLAALWASRASASAGLKEGGRSGSIGRTAQRLANGLVVAEVALALMLVTGAGLLVRSFERLIRVDPGFDPVGVLAVSLTLTDAKYDRPERAELFFRELTERLRRVPGVTEVGATNALPLFESGYTTDYVVAGWPAERIGSEVTHRLVMPGYFAVMRVPLLRGRRIGADDRTGAPPVVLINDVMAREAFGSADPVGQRIAFDRQPDSATIWHTIVGVVASERQRGLAEPPKTEVLQPFAQDPSIGEWLLLRTAGDPMTLLPGVRGAVAELDPNLPIFEARSMETVRTESMARERFLMALLLAFAVVALVLSLVGVYGVIAQFTRQRTQEIGVRLALGAAPQDVRRMVVRRGAALVAAGLGLGLGGAILSTRAMASMLYQVRPADPITFTAVGLALLGAGVLAAWLPARRASRLDPGLALRPE